MWRMGVLAAAAAASCAVQAATLIPVPPVPGARLTVVTAINDNNQIAGGYFTFGGEGHGFYGTLDGRYHTIDGRTGWTSARGISNKGDITAIGNFQSDDHCAWIPFERRAGGDETQILRGIRPLNGFVQGYDTRRRFAGDFCGVHGIRVRGFIGKNAHRRSAPVEIAPYRIVGARGVNLSDAMVGSVSDSDDGPLQAFTILGGVSRVFAFDDAKAVNTVLQGLNADGIAAGHWDKGDFLWQAFRLDTKTDTVTPIDVPGASYVQAFGVNSKGLIAVVASSGSFIWCPDGADCPGAGIHVAQTSFHAALQGLPRPRRSARLRKPAHRGLPDADGRF